MYVPKDSIAVTLNFFAPGSLAVKRDATDPGVARRGGYVIVSTYGYFRRREYPHTHASSGQPTGKLASLCFVRVAKCVVVSCFLARSVVHGRGRFGSLPHVLCHYG